MESKVVELSEASQSKKPGTRLTLSVYNLQSFLISGGLNKSDYIFLMLRLLYGCGQDFQIDLTEFATTLSCSGVTALGTEKEINFEVEDVQIELSKLAKKGLITAHEIPIQLKLSDVQ